MQWNYIDCIVVLGGYFSLLPGVGNVSAIRIIRVLRPLRTLNRVKKLRVIVLTLLGSMKQLANVGVLIMFLFTIYSIVGIQVRADRFCGLLSLLRCAVRVFFLWLLCCVVPLCPCPSAVEWFVAQPLRQRNGADAVVRVRLAAGQHHVGVHR